jgi:magnesium transporter
MHSKRTGVMQSKSEPAILVRRGVILVSLEPVRAIVTADRLYVLVPDGADGLLDPIRARLHKASQQRQDPKTKGAFSARHAGTCGPWDVAFEFAALEVIFMSAAAIKRRDADETHKEASQVLGSVRKSLSSRRLSRVLRLKKRLAEVLNVVSGCRDAFQEVQEDEQMALMYLTALKANAAAFDERLRARSWNTDEVELLLDSYEQEMAAMMRRLKLLEQEIEATEALLKLQLDTARNNLIKVDVSFGVVALFLTACSVISGYYGMNLVNGHENDNDLVFGRSGPSTIWLQVVIISGGGALALIVATLATLWCCGLFQS